MPKKILFIEDEVNMSEMYKIKFEQEGYKVIIADDGEEGIKLAREEQPDLILLDLILPKLSGYEVLRKIKADKETKDIKVYILSNLGQNGEIEQGFKDGANGFMLKANLTPGQLVKNVEKIFKGKKVGIKRRVKIERRQGISTNKETVVLLIEDDEAIIEMYKLRLEKEGYRVEVARNGAWGLRLAKENKFDIIIMDMVMPAMDGYGAISKLKTHDKIKNIPIIVLSNSAQEEDIIKAKRLGVASYLLKSQITPAKLVKEIKNALKANS